MNYEIPCSFKEVGNNHKSIIVQKSFAFAARVVRMHSYLKEAKKEFTLSKQLLRRGTSVGANVREAHNTESNAGFIHKLGIAQKEYDETAYWLELLHETDYPTEKEFESLYSDCQELLKSIILTKKGHPKPTHLS